MSLYVVIRKQATREIVGMGPASGSYEHQVGPDEVKTLEDFEGAYAEHRAQCAMKPVVKTLEERIAALEAKG